MKDYFKYILIFLCIVLMGVGLTVDSRPTIPAPNLELHNIPFHIKRKDEDSPSVVSDVPLIIYQSWHSNDVPTKMKETIYKLLDMNPEFEYYLYSDEKSREFIEKNYSEDVLFAFNALKPGAYKSDLWRYCILYKTGGMYLDIKYVSTVPILNIIKENPVIYVKDLPFACGGKYTGLYNAFMVSPPNNIIFKHCIDDIINSCKFKLYKSGSLHITGPCLLGKIVIEHKGNKYLNNIKFYHTYNSTLEWLRGKNPSIWLNNTQIFKGYDEYRSEQKHFQKTEHYGTMWNNGTVY
jgi:mannosyltransferase OCH1-like enzyme